MPGGFKCARSFVWHVRQLLGKSLKFIDMLPVLIFLGAPAVHSSELCGQESKYTALMPSVVGTMRLVAGVQNMCQRVSTAARHFFLTRDFYTIYAIFTQFYAILRDFCAILLDFYTILCNFCDVFARHKLSAVRHLKLFCTPG